jgi:hypothetical protein
VERIERGRYEELQFPGLGTHTAYGWPPPGDGKQSTLNSVVQGAIRAVGKLDDAAAAAARNVSLSPVGRVEQLKPVVADTEGVLNRARDAVLRERNAVASDRSKLFGVPALEPTDAAGAALDTEIRARYRGFSQDELPGVLNGQTSDEVARILQALMRDPFRTRDRLFAEAMWSEHVAKTQPDAITALKDRDELVDWAAGALAALTQAIAPAKNFGIGGGTGASARAVAPA